MFKLKRSVLVFFAFIGIATFAFLSDSLKASAQSGTINQLQQWSASSTPSPNITQSVFGKALKITGLTTGACLTLDSNSILTTISCGSGGGGSGGGTWSTTTSTVSGRLINYPNNTTDIVTIGSNATTTAPVWFDPNTLINYFQGRVGIGTTSPGTALGVMGKAVIGDDVRSSRYVATSTATSTFVGGIQANIFNATSATASSTFANGINLTAGCFAKNGVCLGLSTLSGNVSLTSQVTGVLPIANGGTASSTSLGGILAGNGTSAIKSAIIGSGLTFDGSTLSATGGSSASTTLLSDVNTFSTVGTTTFSNNVAVRNFLEVGIPNPDRIEQDIMTVTRDADDFQSVTLRNTNAGANASIDLLFNNDASTDTDNYADCGMNSSNYNVPDYAQQNVPNLFYCYTSTGPMSFSSATYIQFLVNGFDSEAIRFTQNGRISIGSSTPNSKLTITNTAADPTLWIESEENDTTPTVLTSSDRFGIATSSPWTTLSVNGIGAMDSIYTTNTTATSTFKGKIDANRLTSATMRVTGLTSCDTIDTDPTGNFICGSDSTGAGGAVTGNGIAGMMASWNSTSNLVATSTIIGNQFIATSTTATSTIASALAIGGATPDANFSVRGIGGKIVQFFTSTGTKLMDIANNDIVTLLGFWDFGDAILEIPNATSPSYGTTGRLALDTTANNLTIATSTLGHQVIWSATSTLYSFSMASTSPYFVSGATKMLPSKSLQQIVTTIWCKVDSGTSKVINLSDGTNDTNSVTCTTTGSEYPITTNATFTPAETINLELGATTGTVNDLIIDIKGYRVSN